MVENPRGAVLPGEVHAILERRLSQLSPSKRKEWDIVRNPRITDVGYEVQQETITKEIALAKKAGKKYLAVPLLRPGHAMLAIVNFDDGNGKIEFYESNKNNSELDHPWIKKTLDHIKKVTGITAVDPIITQTNHQGTVLGSDGRNKNCGVYACYFAEERMKGVSSETIRGLAHIPIFKKRAAYSHMLESGVRSSDIYSGKFADDSLLKEILLDDFRVEHGLKSIDDMTPKEFVEEYRNARKNLIVQKKQAEYAMLEHHIYSVREESTTFDLEKFEDFISSNSQLKKALGQDYTDLVKIRKSIDKLAEERIDLDERLKQFKIMKDRHVPNVVKKLETYMGEIQLSEASNTTGVDRQWDKLSQYPGIERIEGYEALKAARADEKIDYERSDKDGGIWLENLEDVKEKMIALVERVRELDRSKPLWQRYDSIGMVSLEESNEIDKDVLELDRRIAQIEAESIQEKHPPKRIKTAVSKDLRDISHSLPDRSRLPQTGKVGGFEPRTDTLSQFPHDQKISVSSLLKVATIPLAVSAFATMIYVASDGSVRLAREEDAISDSNCKKVSKLNLKSQISLLSDSLEFSSIINQAIK